MTIKLVHILVSLMTSKKYTVWYCLMTIVHNLVQFDDIKLVHSLVQFDYEIAQSDTDWYRLPTTFDTVVA